MILIIAFVLSISSKKSWLAVSLPYGNQTVIGRTCGLTGEIQPGTSRKAQHRRGQQALPDNGLCLGWADFYFKECWYIKVFMDLFERQAQAATASQRPLAERMRPRRLADLFGQQNVTAPDSPVRRAIENDRLFSMILWGPPGCGKTTLARIIASETRSHFIHFSAVLSGVKQIREVIGEARKNRQFQRKRTVLFVDEIHRFNKAQQDAFLHHVESGLITLIGATTENPSFEVVSALLSRCRVILLNLLDENALGSVLDRALTDSENGLGQFNLSVSKNAREHLVRTASGDARSLLNSLELIAAGFSADASPRRGRSRRIVLEDVERALETKALLYDKDGEEHYNLISALHKSMRGSDPDAALYWLARMLAAGEDPLYVARRMVRFASEDVGNADPFALQIALSAVEAFRLLGPPEGELALAQAAVYLATAPKSNSVYQAWKSALQIAKEKGSLPVPLPIRNAPTRLMKKLGYGKGYRYAHDYDQGYVSQEYLPDSIARMRFYHPTDQGYEKMIGERLKRWKALKQKPPSKNPVNKSR